MSYAFVRSFCGPYSSVCFKMSAGIPAIFEFPGVTITSSRLEAGVIKMVRRLRPDWQKEDIILQSFSSSTGISQNIALGKDCKDLLYGGYTTDKSEMVVVKVFKAFFDEFDTNLIMQQKVS